MTVLGAPGVGKSRLVLELERVVSPTATVLRGRCLSYGDGITYWPLAAEPLSARAASNRP